MPVIPTRWRAAFDAPNHTFVHGEIGDKSLAGKLHNDHKITAMINLAAESHVDRSIDSSGEFVQTNVVDTFHLLQSALDSQTVKSTEQGGP